jgi:hypothetical protein
MYLTNLSRFRFKLLRFTPKITIGFPFYRENGHLSAKEEEVLGVQVMLSIQHGNISDPEGKLID